MVLSSILSQERESLVIITSMLTVETVLTSSLPRAPVTCALVSMVSTPTPTPVCAISSMPVWTELQRSTPAPPGSGLTSTAVSATGQRPQIGKIAKLTLTVCIFLHQILASHADQYYSFGNF